MISKSVLHNTRSHYRISLYVLRHKIERKIWGATPTQCVPLVLCQARGLLCQVKGKANSTNRLHLALSYKVAAVYVLGRQGGLSGQGLPGEGSIWGKAGLGKPRAGRWLRAAQQLPNKPVQMGSFTP